MKNFFTLLIVLSCFFFAKASDGYANEAPIKCEFQLSINGIDNCTLESYCDGALNATFDLNTLTWKLQGDLIVIRDANGNSLSGRIEQFTSFGSTTTLFAYLANAKSGCGGGGTGGDTIVFNTCPNDIWMGVLCDYLAVPDTSIEFTRIYTRDCLGAVTTQDYDIFGAPYTIQGTVAECEPPCEEYEVVYYCFCDDISGDSTEFTTYYTATRICVSTGESELIGTFDDKSLASPYTPVNTVNCSLGGRNAEIGYETRVLTVGSFTSNPLMTSLTYTVRDEGNGVTISDGSNTTSLLTGDSGGFENSDYRLSEGSLVISADQADVLITYKILK
jgi:hypothetical protein